MGPAYPASGRRRKGRVSQIPQPRPFCHAERSRRVDNLQRGKRTERAQIPNRARAPVLHSPLPPLTGDAALANARAPRPDAACTRARGVRLRPADGRRRAGRGAPHADAAGDPHAHPHGNPGSDRDAYARPLPPHRRRPLRYSLIDTHADTPTDRNAHSYANTYSHANTNSRANTYSHANTDPCAVPMDGFPARRVARRRADRPRRLRGHATIGNVRVGAPQQARRRRRGGALPGLDHRSRDRRHPAHRRRVPRVRWLRLVDAQASSDTDSHA